MKKIFFPGVLLALMFVFSCTKDQYTEEQAQQAQTDLISYQDSIDQVRDSLNKIGGIIQYSVSVIPVDGGTGFVNKSVEKIKGLAGATVTVSQHGVLLTDTTDESGIAVFNDLRVGTFNVNVRSEGYTTVNFIAEVKPETNINVNVYYDVLRTAATMVPVFNITENTANIKGQLTYESDLTNKTPEPAAGVTVVAVVDVDDASFVNNYLTPLMPAPPTASTFGVYNAPIVQIAYTDLLATGVTDANGNYELDMPASSDGLPVKMDVSDVVVDQKLLLSTLFGENVFGVQTVRTVFNSALTTATASALTAGTPAYVTFSSPTGAIVQKPIVTATATAIIGESGIASVSITNQGDGYTQAPIVRFTATPFVVGTATGEGAEAVAYISDGKVTSIEITNPGKGYAVNDVINVTFTDKVGVTALAKPTITYSVTSYTLGSAGSGYKSVPDVTVTSSTGSGAAAKAIMSGYVSDVKVTNMGSDYICIPDVVISGSTGTDATATARMTTFNPIHSIVLQETFRKANLYRMAPVVTIESTTGVGGSLGSGATAVAIMEDAGGIAADGIELTNAGAGYLEAPAVLVTGGSGTGAVAYSTLNADGTINIVVPKAGTGYKATDIIKVDITAPPAGGTQATANAIVSYLIKEIVVTNPGSGYATAYEAVNTGTNVDFYFNEPNFYLNKQTGGTALTDVQVAVRPNMKVESIAFTAGSDYPSIPTVTINSECGTGSGAAATAEILSSVKKLEVVSPGSGYTYDGVIVVNIVTPADGCTTQATASVVGNATYSLSNLTKGVLSSIELTEAGDNYLAPPYVKFAAVAASDNSGALLEEDAKIEANISNGKVTGFTIVKSGQGYGWANPNAVPAPFTIDISTKTVTATAGAKASASSGKISFVNMILLGEGYTTEPLVRFIRLDGLGNAVLINNAFTEAEADVVMEDGRVTAINITNPGTGYYYAPTVEIYMPDGLMIARGTIVYNTIVGTANPDGFIKSITVDNGGAGYASAPTVTIVPSVPGMGSGATGTAIVSGGVVRGVTITNAGSGYLGRNYPATAAAAVYKPGGAIVPVTIFPVIGGKTYIKDIYLGTGYRTVN